MLFYRNKNEKICLIGIDFWHLPEIYLTNMEKQLLDAANKTRVDVIKTAFKKIIHKAAEAKGESIGNEIANKIVKAKPLSDENSRNTEEMVIPPEKREEILNELRQIL